MKTDLIPDGAQRRSSGRGIHGYQHLGGDDDDADDRNGYGYKDNDAIISEPVGEDMLQKRMEEGRPKARRRASMDQLQAITKPPEEPADKFDSAAVRDLLLSQSGSMGSESLHSNLSD